MLKIGNLSEERKEEEKMKKKMGFAVLSIAAFMFAIHSASALTEYKFDGWYAENGYGSKTKVDENITNLKGNETASGGMYVGPFSKAAKNVKLADGITEEVHVGLDFDKIKEGEYFEASLALKTTNDNNEEKYVSEAVVMSQRVGDKIKLTVGWAKDFEAYIQAKGVYTYQWKMWIETEENAKKTYVQFTLLQGEKEIATTGKIDFDTLTTADTLNPIAEQKDVTVKYLWFCNINVKEGVNIYTEVPTVTLTFVSPIKGEEDEKLEVYKYMSFTESDIEEMIKEIKAAAKEEGYKFEGFYADEKFTTEFDFTKPFEGNVSIYTKLTKIVNESQTKEEEKNPKTSDMNLALILTSLGLASVGAVLVSRKKLAKVNR
ncbi:MAG: InlB B-repeat-containing protein [Candidatus Gastranaerophilaceae bacterium]